MARPKKEENAAGGVEITLLCVYGGNQPGDKVSVSKEVAEELIKNGWAEK